MSAFSRDPRRDREVAGSSVRVIDARLELATSQHVQVSEQEERVGRVFTVLSTAVTAVVALGLGWVAAAVLGEPPSDRWGHAVGLAVSVTVVAAVTPSIRRRTSRRETSRGRMSCGLSVIEGSVPGLKTGWTMGHAALRGGRVDFDRRRFPFQRGRGGIVSLTVSSRSQPRDSTLRESLRVGTDARVVDLVTTTGARVRLAAVLPTSLAPALAALDA